MTTLVIYATRRGATAKSAEVVAGSLRSAGMDVSVVDARRARRRDLEAADAFVLGSSVAMGRWKGSARRLLPKLAGLGKPTAVFVSAAGTLSGMQPGEKAEGVITASTPGGAAAAVAKYIDPVVATAGVKPVATAAFGGFLAMFGKEMVRNWDGAAVESWAATLPAVLAPSGVSARVSAPRA